MKQRSETDQSTIERRTGNMVGRHLLALAPRRLGSRLVLAAVATTFVVGLTALFATPTQTPTATLTPLPPTPTPEPTPVPASVEDLEITDSTTVGDMMATLSADGVACVRDTLGAGTFDAIQNVALASVPPPPPGTADLPFECIAPENTVGISIAFMSAEAEGLSAETRSCTREVAMENPSVLGIGEPPANPAGAMGAAIQMHLCLSDKEAAALAGNGEAGLPPPSAMRCIEQQLGGQDELAAVFSGQVTNEEAAFSLFAAVLACEVNLARQVRPVAEGSGSRARRAASSRKLLVA